MIKLHYLFVLAIFATTAIGVFPSMPACSQDAKPSAGRLTPEQVKKRKALFKTAALNKQIDIPYLPMCPGKCKFMQAFAFPSLGGGNHCINESFLVAQETRDVVNWYKQVLPSFGWSVQPGNKAGNQITVRRMKEGITCHISVMPSPDKNYQSVMQIRCIQFSQPQS